MSHYPRMLDLESILKHRSIFLFGPRQTGKTSFLRATYPTARYFDLLDARVFRELSANPERMREALGPQDRLVIVDEIQKLPGLLDEVQLVIGRNPAVRFILTGSSARKLKRGAANLLAGRALMVSMHPLVSKELNFQLLEKRLSVGSLPSIIDSPIATEDLYNYVGTYLKEEIQAEGLSRNIEHFSRFLEVAGLTNGQLLNYTEMGSDAGIAPRTVQNYFHILKDTLIGYELPPYRKTKSRKAIATAKFYFFDVGVVHGILGRQGVTPKTPEYGRALEHLIFLELRAYLDYSRSREELCFWRTHAQQEVDFLIGSKVAIEVKAKERISDRDLSGIRTLAEDLSLQRKLLVAQVPWRSQSDDGIEMIPVQDFLQDLWDKKII